MSEVNMYVINRDSISEYVIAKSQSEAINFYAGYIGVDSILEAFENYLKAYPDKNYIEFIDYFISLEKFKDKNGDDVEFICMEDDGTETVKTLKQWLDEVGETPCYFGCEEY
jgi:hypothetical protein